MGKGSSQTEDIISELEPEHPFSHVCFVVFGFVCLICFCLLFSSLNYKPGSDCLPPCSCIVPKEPCSWPFDSAVLKTFHNNKASSVNGKARRLDFSQL